MVWNLKQPSHKLVTSTSKVKQTANRLPDGIFTPIRHLLSLTI
jgi:hypothetical protein